MTCSKFYSVLFLTIVLLTGCATSSTHTGKHWAQKEGRIETTSGLVSARAAREAQSFVDRFHALIIAGDLKTAYDMLDQDLQSQISASDFETAWKKIEIDFGPETDFEIQPDPTAAALKEVLRTGADEAVVKDSLKYYEAVVARYLSKRNRDIFVKIGVRRSGENDLKIASVAAIPTGEKAKPVLQVVPQHPVIK